MIQSILIYALTFALTIYLSYLYEKKLKKNDYQLKYENFYLVLIVLPLLILSSIRYGIGTDYFTYRDLYYYINDSFDFSVIFSHYIEPLYVLLNFIAKVLFNNYQGIFVLSSFIFLFFSIKGINNFKQKISIPLAVFILCMVYFQMSFNIIRQLMAVSIIFYATKYIFNKKFFKYLFCVLLAAGFHKTSIICLIFYFIFPTDEMHEKRNFLYYLAVMVFTILVPVFVEILEYFLITIGKDSIYFTMNADKSFKFLLYILPILLIVFMNRRRIIKPEFQNEFFLRMLILQIPIQYMGYFVKNLDRISVYVSIFQVLLIPILLKNYPNKNLKRIVICWYLIYYIIMFILMNSNQTYPFQFLKFNM